MSAHVARSVRGLSTTLIILSAAAGTECSSTRAAAKPPHAEFVLSSTDSSFWVTSSGNGVRVRGVPLVLARYDGHYYELYSADDDFSFDDALLLGQRLYRRDLASGDSAVVLADTIVARVAMSYARAHPDERPLSPGEDGEANPSTSATAEIDILDIFGPFVSYEYHVDVEQPGERLWHTTRRGVIDLRTGKQSSVGEVFDAASGASLTASGRRSYESIRDSIEARRATLRGDDRRAADALASRPFDERSFSVERSGGAPAVVFGVPGRGFESAGNLVALAPLPVWSAAWWNDVRSGLADSDTSGETDVDRWKGLGYTVIARYDTTGQIAAVSIADSSKREFAVGTITGPLRRIDWLDNPQIGAADRAALTRAFNQAATYDETARVALSGSRLGTQHLAAAIVSSHTPAPKSSFVRRLFCSPRAVSVPTHFTSHACVRERPSMRAGTKRRS